MQERLLGLEKAAWVATGLFALLIGYFALIPPTNRALPVPSDKVMHAFAFAVLVLPMSIMFARKALLILAAAVAYGALIEIVQPITGRMFEIADIWADGVGACIGIGLGAVLAGVVRRVRQT